LVDRALTTFDDTAARVEVMARVCHEANRAYALAIGERASTLHPHYDEASEEIRASARAGVHKALEGATPEQLHESWMRSKTAAGWIYGPVRDNALRVHPCLVPYHELPTEQQRKDALFYAIVGALR
jgi:RyR domain